MLLNQTTVLATNINTSNIETRSSGRENIEVSPQPITDENINNLVTQIKAKLKEVDVVENYDKVKQPVKELIDLVVELDKYVTRDNFININANLSNNDNSPIIGLGNMIKRTNNNAYFLEKGLNSLINKYNTDKSVGISVSVLYQFAMDNNYTTNLTSSEKKQIFNYLKLIDKNETNWYLHKESWLWNDMAYFEINPNRDDTPVPEIDDTPPVYDNTPPETPPPTYVEGENVGEGNVNSGKDEGYNYNETEKKCYYTVNGTQTEVTSDFCGIVDYTNAERNDENSEVYISLDKENKEYIKVNNIKVSNSGTITHTDFEKILKILVEKGKGFDLKDKYKTMIILNNNSYVFENRETYSDVDLQNIFNGIAKFEIRIKQAEVIHD